MKRSALSLIGSLVGLVYLAYLCFELLYAQNPRFLTIEAAGFSMRVAALLPTAVLTGAAVLLGLIGFAARKRGPVLAAAILLLISMPLVMGMYAIPLALSLILLADFFASLIRGRRNKHAKAPEADNTAPGKADEADDPMEIEPAFDDDMMDDDAADDDLNDNFDEPADDAGDDLRLETILEDVTDDPEEESRPRADGMAVFLGVFMGLVALAFIGMIIYGAMGGKLPFMP
jgi:uncharacterized membrane protein (DUF485 family)